jgi:hypothetical protein
VLTEEKLDNIGARLETSPRKSLKRLAPEMNVLKTSARKVTKLLKLQVNKTTVVHTLKEHDPVTRIHFCNWFIWFVHDAQVDSQLVNTQALLDAGKEVGLEVNPEKTKYMLGSRCQRQDRGRP